MEHDFVLSSRAESCYEASCIEDRMLRIKHGKRIGEAEAHGLELLLKFILELTISLGLLERFKAWICQTLRVWFVKKLRCMFKITKIEDSRYCRLCLHHFWYQSLTLLNVYFLNEDKKVCWTEIYFECVMNDEDQILNLICSIHNCKWTGLQWRKL